MIRLVGIGIGSGVRILVAVVLLFAM